MSVTQGEERTEAGPGDKLAFLRRLQDSSLSPSHCRIARYLTRHYRTAASQTAVEVAATVKTSEATVIRFALRLGYDGYPALRRHLHAMIREDLTSVELLGRSLPHRGRRRDALTTVVEAETERLRALASGLPREEVTRLVKGLVGAARVYVAGHRASAALAQFFGYTLAKVHPDVVTVTEGGARTCEAFRTVPSSAWLVAIAFPRYSRDTVELVQFAREERIVVAAITDSVLSPIAKGADLVLPVETAPISFVDAHCAAQGLLTAVLVEYGVRARERTEAMLQRFERLAIRHTVFHLTD